jgi:acetyl-CoA carboxylase biotin carboxyl carrier protein
MSKDNLSYDELLQVLDVLKASEQFSELRVRVGEMELQLRRGDNGIRPAPIAAPASTPSAPVVAPTQKSAKVEVGDLPAGAVVIRAPMVGTFYRAPEPGAKPYVEVGAKVSADTTVCLIEVMKLFNSIPAGWKGVVTRILAEDKDPVEHGQALMVVEPRRAA